MKKVLLSLAIIATLGAKAQSYTTGYEKEMYGKYLKKFEKNYAFVSMSYGGASTIGVDAMIGKIGFGLSLGMKGPVGEDYSDVIGPNAFREDIYEVVNAKSVSVRLIAGDNITDELKIAGMLGVGTTRDFFNAYDDYQILNPSGYYYTSANEKTSILYGFLANYRISEPDTIFGISWGMHIGYNNFDNFNAGISINF